MRIDTSQNLLVGTTDSAPRAGDTNTGVSFRATGDAFFSTQHQVMEQGFQVKYK